MTSQTIRPTAVALAVSHINGSCIPQPSTNIRWLPCPECAKTQGKRLTVCKVCGNAGRIAVVVA